MHVLVFRRAKIAPVKKRLDASQEVRAGRHHVNELAVLRAGLTHQNAPVLFDDLRFDFTRMLVHQGFERRLAGDHCLAHFLDAGGAQ
jgi:hypothetical protein